MSLSFLYLSNNINRVHTMMSKHTDQVLLKRKIDVILCIIFVILFLTFLFEYLHDFLSKKVKAHSHLLKETFEALFKELMVLGFISLLLFFLTRVGITQRLNDMIFGEDKIEVAAKKELKEEGKSLVLAPTVLYELFENIHICIFLIMTLFIAIVIFLIVVAMRQSFQWKKFQNHTIREKQIAIENDSCTTEELEFWIIHKRFLNPTTPFSYVPNNPSDFPFHEYLSEKMNSNLLQMVEIPYFTWITLFLIAIILRPVLDFSVIYRLAFVDYCAVCVCIFSIALSIKLRSIKRKLRPSIDNVQRFLLYIGNGDETVTAGMAPIDTLDFIMKNNLFGKCFQQREYINRQEKLFPFGCKGPHYLLYCIQLTLFLHVIVCTMICRMLLSLYSHKDFGAFPLWIMHLLCLGVCIVCFLMLWPVILRDFTLCTSIELFTDKIVIKKIEKEVEERKWKKNKQILFCLKEIFEQSEKAKSEESMKALIEKGRLWIKSLPDQDYKCYLSLFHNFCEKNGRISQKSLFRLLKRLKLKHCHLPQDLLNRWYDNVSLLNSMSSGLNHTKGFKMMTEKRCLNYLIFTEKGMSRWMISKKHSLVLKTFLMHLISNNFFLISLNNKEK
ncbi:uncharacterized protein LOC128883482 isoform X3 [Hylaeus volcanicus]|uniref:uncharacterized protein LOC128883482 isoform X3 n=1 Tax=Hylaeus volcanicus TaxID=313075 RepID=UPI0023B86654|nr:uncharacterized protein LOC128883482 isoform X3 [Hylaeus volcanicus]